MLYKILFQFLSFLPCSRALYLSYQYHFNSLDMLIVSSYANIIITQNSTVLMSFLYNLVTKRFSDNPDFSLWFVSEYRCALRMEQPLNIIGCSAFRLTPPAITMTGFLFSHE